MHTSAKVTMSIFIAAALGAVGFACTVGTTTNNDFDGGTNASSSSSSSGNTSSSSSSGSAEAGSGGLCPQTNQPFEPATCDTCLKTSCCTEVAECFAIVDAPNSGPVGCNSYTGCVVQCQADAKGDTAKEDDCIKNTCQLVADPKVPPLYEKFVDCREAKCKTECPAE